jgi:hypothetical protein
LFFYTLNPSEVRTARFGRVGFEEAEGDLIEKDDWRLMGQEKFLRGATLELKVYSKAREDWDHDHCAFCQAKFMEPGTPETLHEGYTTPDNYYWICVPCCEDFREMFEWVIRK